MYLCGCVIRAACAYTCARTYVCVRARLSAFGTKKKEHQRLILGAMADKIQSKKKEVVLSVLCVSFLSALHTPGFIK